VLANSATSKITKKNHKWCRLRLEKKQVGQKGTFSRFLWQDQEYGPINLCLVGGKWLSSYITRLGKEMLMKEKPKVNIVIKIWTEIFLVNFKYLRQANVLSKQRNKKEVGVHLGCVEQSSCGE